MQTAPAVRDRTMFNEHIPRLTFIRLLSDFFPTFAVEWANLGHSLLPLIIAEHRNNSPKRWTLARKQRSHHPEF